MIKLKKIPKNLSNEEHLALYRLGIRMDITEVFRKSKRQFDIEIEGEMPSVFGKKHDPVPFTAWLPLFVVREYLKWTHEDIAWMTDYPEMAMKGDWSAVRDSSRSKIWAIFRKYGKAALIG